MFKAIVVAVLLLAVLWYVSPLAAAVITLIIGGVVAVIYFGVPLAAFGGVVVPVIIFGTLIYSIAEFNGGFPNLLANSPQEIANPDRGQVVQEPPPAPVVKAKPAVVRTSAPAKKCKAKGSCDAAGKPLPKFLVEYKAQNGL